MKIFRVIASSVLLHTLYGTAQTTAPTAPQSNSSYIDPQGTAHITRIVPVPTTVSPEAQKSLAQPVSDANVPESLAERRTKTDTWQAKAGEAYRQVYPATISSTTMGGVPVRVITPPLIGTGKSDRVLLNLHGGGFNSDSGSFTESIPISNITQTKVIAVLYRLAPEHPFPAAVEDAVAVYKELLKTYKPHNIAIYGTSAGAILTAETAVKLKQLGLPMPGALGIFSGMGDFSQAGDSVALYSLRGLSGHLDPPKAEAHDPEYVGSTNPKDPVLSPVYADLRGMPPTLFVTSTRDLLLSGTVNLHRAFLRAGSDAQLVVFDALPHAFWNDVDLPESREADEIMAHFFDTHLGK
ncbi:MAG TPA: alpha/beta hydrolase fold domain-containing protein [Pseudacidobacterium sp.]|nr:alpha/beta hydrolase fold domain-containing protein [Pseudacidobacterium sp.]